MDRDLRTQIRRIVTERDPHEHARLLAAQIRAGTKVPMPMRNAPPLNIVVPKRKHCLLHAWEDRPADALPVLRLRAYAGDEAALSVVELPPDLEWKRKCIEPAWLTGLLRLAEDLPPVAVSGAECWRHGASKGTPSCLLCKPTSAWRYLAVCIGLAVGRACLDGWEITHANRDEFHVWRTGVSACGCENPRRALDACERWTWCPCPVNAEAWRQAWVLADDDAQGPVWVPSPRPTIARIQAIVEAAARRVSPEAVREAARLMVLEVMGELG